MVNRQILHFQNRLFGDVLGNKVVIFDVTAGQVVSKLLTGQVLGLTGVDVLTAAHDTYVVGNFEDLIGLVGDEHDGDAGITQLTNGDEQSVNFLLGQSGGGLVHDDQLGVEQHSAADSDQLLGSNVQIAHLSVQVDIAADLCQSGLCGFIPALAVDQLTAGGDFGVDGQVLTNGQVGENGQVLVDDLDAQAGSLGGGDLGNFVALEGYGAFILGVDTGDDLNQSGLAAAVFACEAHNFTGTDTEVYIVQGVNAAETLVNSGHLKQIFFRHGKLLLLIWIGKMRKGLKRGRICGCRANNRLCVCRLILPKIRSLTG